MKSIEESNLINQPERLEKLMTDLYKDSPRYEILYDSGTQQTLKGPINVERMSADSCEASANTDPSTTLSSTTLSSTTLSSTTTVASTASQSASSQTTTTPSSGTVASRQS